MFLRIEYRNIGISELNRAFYNTKSNFYFFFFILLFLTFEEKKKEMAFRRSK